MLVDVYNKDGQVSGQVELTDDIFAAEPNENAMHMAIVIHLAHQRQGTHKTKGRAEVSGGGKKPWRQKGRGTARAGSTRSPLWSGGGTVFGPQPHKYSPKLPKKMRRLARKSALSLRFAEQNLIVLEDFVTDEIKTKNVAQMLQNLKISSESILMLLPEKNDMIYLSARNIPKLSVMPADKISTYDILSHKKLVLFKGAIEPIVNGFAN